MKHSTIRRSLGSLATSLALAGFTSLLGVTGAVQPLAAQAAQPLAITGVHIVPMDRERVLRHHTVLIRGGEIVAMGPAGEITIPAGAEVIDGRGRYLIPGLADMHIHAVRGTGERGDDAWRQMTLLVASGVTTARSLSGAPTAMELRDAIRAGAVLGPELYLAGPSLNYRSVTTPESARTAVREQAAAGYEFLKTHGVTGDVYAAIVDAAAEQGVPLVGHVMPDYGLERALAAGQQIEHLDGYLPAMVPADAPIPTPPGQFFFGPELDHMTEAAIPGLVRRTLAAGVWNSPTLALFEIVARPDPVEAYRALPEMRFVPAAEREKWAGQVAQLAAEPIPAERRQRYLDLRNALTRALRDAGAGLLAGSDSPQLFMVPGYSLHRELEVLQRAGLTAYEALATATSNPARYLGEALGAGTIGARARPSGVVIEGAEADLVLLEANPLEDVSNTRRIRGVVLDGRWLGPDRLEALKDGVAEAVAEAAAGGG